MNISRIPTTQYDNDIKRFHDSFGLPYDWLMLKAQLMQESRLDCHAVSPVGAKGLAQFMPGTWAEYVGKCSYPHSTSPFNASASIHCCAAYMKDLLKGWKSERTAEDRYKLALASYNAGFGNLLKAQKLAKGAVDYKHIIAKLPLVTGKANSRETMNYVIKIYEYYEQFRLAEV